MSNTFTFSSKAKMISLICLGIGLLATIAGFMMAPDRAWSNLLQNSYFFMGVSLISVFFIAIHSVGYGGWFVAIKRIPEAISHFLPIAGIFIAIIAIGAYAHIHHLYHWAVPGVGDPASEHFDAIIAAKLPYFSAPFFLTRVIGFIVIWVLLAAGLRKLSRKQDEDGNITHYTKSKTLSAIFLVVFGVSTSVLSWDLIMSIDTHWFSTLFGWYNFASYFVSGIAMILLFTIYMKHKGLLPNVNDSHIHDLGKFMFAFSIFWTYLWFSQYMLQWYANIPEETFYFKARIDNVPFLFFLNVFINFVFPFFILMTRRAKRNKEVVVLAACIILCGHWLDFWLMIAPGAQHGHPHFGLLEITMPFLFIGAFIYVVFNALSKMPILTPEKHPFIRESVQHHI